MEFHWQYDDTDQEPISLKVFLKRQGISKRLLAKVKFHGGKLLVNGQEETVRYMLNQKDEVTVTTPAEPSCDIVAVEDLPLDLVYEDEHILVINKPWGVPSIPSQYHQGGTIVNRVKGYYLRQGYEDLRVHVVTRLDRDTSGLMLLARHGFAHALMDAALRKKSVEKEYVAIVSDHQSRLLAHEDLFGNIMRAPDSIMKRMVTQDLEAGKAAHTEYWLEDRAGDYGLVRVQLHTGRTHQIRVHFAHIGCPLLGDDLYGGTVTAGMKRQALHCQRLTFYHPFTNEHLTFTAPLASDMKSLLGNLKK